MPAWRPALRDKARPPVASFPTRCYGAMPFAGRGRARSFNLMALDKATVARIATLARIKVPEAVQESLAGELSQILTWIEQLGEVDTTGVEPMSSVAAMMLPMRDDVV